VLVDELRPIVGVDAPQAKRQRLAQLFEGRLHGRLALAEDRGGLDPGGVDIGEVERVHELAVPETAAVGDQINLGEARRGDIPAVGLERDVVLEQRAGLRAPIQPLAQLLPVRPEATIHLAGTNGPQLPLDVGAQAQPATCPWQPQRQQSLEPHRPGIPRGLPDHPQRLNSGDMVARGAPLGRAGRARGRPVEHPDGRLAVIAYNSAELVQDPPLLRSPCMSITLIDRLHVLSLGSHTHDGFLHRERKVTSQMARRSLLGNILDGARRPL
jgi:hypothetical protein